MNTLRIRFGSLIVRLTTGVSITYFAALVCFENAPGQAPTASVTQAKPMEVQIIGQSRPIQIDTISKPGLWTSSFTIAFCSFFLALSGFLFSMFQFKRQRQVAQMEMVERLFGELRRTELEFTTPIASEVRKHAGL